MYIEKFFIRIFYGVFLISCSFVLMILLISPANAAPNGKVLSEPISPGTVQELYNWNTGYGNARIGVIRCDLTNPNLDLKVVAGQGSYTKKATVSQMSARTNAVALLNGDYFNMALQGSPIGPSIIDGRLQSSPAVIEGLFSLGIDKSNKAYIEAMTFSGKICVNGNSFPIDGLNKTYYWHDPSGQESHTDTIQLYNDFWTSQSRGHSTNGELLLNSNNIVEKISYGKQLPYPVPKGKCILQFSGSAEKFIKNNIQEGKKIDLEYQILPNRNWKFLIGGHAMLVNNGQVVKYYKDINVLGGVRARTATGISQDGKTVWFITAEGRTNRSAGLSLDSLSHFMRELGCFRAVNLDGGGSSAMITTALGSLNREMLIYPERFNHERPVVNGIGVYNNTPKGDLAGIKINGRQTLIIGESTKYDIFRAWDTNLHAVKVNDIKYSINDSKKIGRWSENWMLATKTGSTEIIAKTDTGIVGKLAVNVIGEEGIKKIYIKMNKSIVKPGDQIKCQLRALTKDGRDIPLSSNVAHWSVSGFSNRIKGALGQYTIESLNNDKKAIVSVSIGHLMATKYLYNSNYNFLNLYINQNNYYLNDVLKKLDQPPIIFNNRALVPLRLISEKFNGKVDWTPKDKEIKISLNNKTILMYLNDKRAYINNMPITLDVAPKVINGRTLVPIRFISESLGMGVEYAQDARSITIIGKKL